MHQRCPSARPQGAARLADHRLRFPLASRRWGGGVADVLPAAGDEVWGALWLIDAEEAAALDAQEGVHATPPRYLRAHVEVERADSERVRCLAYRVAPAAADVAELAPSAAYRDTMLRGARAFDLPAAYVARLAALPVAGG